MFKIDENGKLLRNGKPVRRVMSQNTGGPFSEKISTTVIHYTNGGSAISSAEWFRNPENKSKSSAHVVVDRDGEVIQCVDFNNRANHAGPSFWRGRSGLNAWSFGIELSNWGYLKNQSGLWMTWTGKIIPTPVMAIHKNGNPDGSKDLVGWEPYPSVQLEAAAGIVQALKSTYGPQEIVGHDDIAPGRKWDPGPAFDMAHFRDLAVEDASGEGNGLIKVATPGDTLNLRKGPGIQYDVIITLADGTLMQPMEIQSNWAHVNVLNGEFQAVKSGWVNSRMTIPA